MRTSIQVAVFLVGFALFSVAVKRELRRLPSGQTALRVQQEAPAFTLPDTQGEPVELRAVAQRNKVVLVSFWASWCEPCRMELPELKAFYEKYHSADSSFEVMAVSTDEDRYQAEKYVKEAKLPFPVVWDENGTIADKYGVESIPVLYVIDENGKVIHGQIGYGFGLEIKLKMFLGLKDGDAKKAQSDDDSSN